MKRSHFLFAMAAMGILLFSSCKHSTSPGGGNQVVMTAIVNGKAWSGIIPVIGQYDFSAADSNSVIFMYHMQTDTGTYSVGGPTDSLYMTYSLHLTNYNSIPHSGTVHFTTLTSSKVVGTFNFTAADATKDTVIITNGTFNIAR